MSDEEIAQLVQPIRKELKRIRAKRAMREVASKNLPSAEASQNSNNSSSLEGQQATHFSKETNRNEQKNGSMIKRERNLREREGDDASGTGRKAISGLLAKLGAFTIGEEKVPQHSLAVHIRIFSNYPVFFNK